jgi:hypothetical protein
LGCRCVGERRSFASSVPHVFPFVFCVLPAPKAGASAASKPVSKPAVASKPKPASDAPRRTGGFGGEGAATGEDGEAIKGGDSRGGRGCVTLSSLYSRRKGGEGGRVAWRMRLGLGVFMLCAVGVGKGGRFSVMVGLANFFWPADLLHSLGPDCIVVPLWLCSGRGGRGRGDRRGGRGGDRPREPREPSSHARDEHRSHDRHDGTGRSVDLSNEGEEGGGGWGEREEGRWRWVGERGGQTSELGWGVCCVDTGATAVSTRTATAGATGARRATRRPPAPPHGTPPTLSPPLYCCMFSYWSRTCLFIRALVENLRVHFIGRRRVAGGLCGWFGCVRAVVLDGSWGVCTLFSCPSFHEYALSHQSL